MSDIKEWARERWADLHMSLLTVDEQARLLAQEAYERGRLEGVKAGMAVQEKWQDMWQEGTQTSDEGGLMELVKDAPLSDRPASSKTIRQEFAMAAMQGLLSAWNNPEFKHEDTENLPKLSTKIADALIAALGKTEGR